MTTRVQVAVVPEDDSDDEELALLTSDLGDELGQLDAEVEAPAPTDVAPTGAKGIGAAEIGQLIVTLSTAPVLATVIDCLRRWVRRPGAASVRLSIGDEVLEIAGEPSERQTALIAAFLERHAG